MDQPKRKLQQTGGRLSNHSNVTDIQFEVMREYYRYKKPKERPTTGFAAVGYPGITLRQVAAKFNCSHVAVYHSVSRLISKGMMCRREYYDWRGYYITSAGRKALKAWMKTHRAGKVSIHEQMRAKKLAAMKKSAPARKAAAEEKARYDRGEWS